MSYFPNELLNMYMEDSIIYVKEDTLRVFSNGLTITYDHKSTFKVNVYPQNNSLCFNIEVTTQQNLFLKNQNYILHYCSWPRFMIKFKQDITLYQDIILDRYHLDLLHMLHKERNMTT